VYDTSLQISFQEFSSFTAHDYATHIFIFWDGFTKDSKRAAAQIFRNSPLAQVLVLVQSKEAQDPTVTLDFGDSIKMVESINEGIQVTTRVGEGGGVRLLLGRELLGTVAKLGCTIPRHPWSQILLGYYRVRCGVLRWASFARDTGKGSTLAQAHVHGTSRDIMLVDGPYIMVQVEGSNARRAVYIYQRMQANGS
jgi:hypothetical protein